MDLSMVNQQKQLADDELRKLQTQQVPGAGVAAPPLTGGTTAPGGPSDLRQSAGQVLTERPSDPQGLTEMRSGDKSDYTPEGFAAAQKIPVIRGTADSSLIPANINNLTDLANAIRGMGLDKTYAGGLGRNPEHVKAVNANRLGQLAAVSKYAEAQVLGQSHVEGARLSAGAKGSKDAILSDMLKKQEDEKVRGVAQKQFFDSLVSGGQATVDAKTGKPKFTHPAYQKEFDEYAQAVQSAPDAQAIQGITAAYKQRIGEVGDFVEYSKPSVLRKLPDDLERFGQDFIKAMPEVFPGTNRLLKSGNVLTQEGIEHLRAQALKGDAATIRWIKEVQHRKENAGVAKERSAAAKTEQARRELLRDPKMNQVPLAWRGLDRRFE